MITKKKLEKKKKPSRSSFIFHCNNTIYMHTTTKKFDFEPFPFRIFLELFEKTSINFPVRNFWKSLLQYILSIYLHEKEKIITHNYSTSPVYYYYTVALLSTTILF